MPLAGTGDLLGIALLAGRDAVAGAFRATHPDPSKITAAHIAQLRTDMAKSDGNIIVAHILANAAVLGTAAGVTVGAASAPVAGKVI